MRDFTRQYVQSFGLTIVRVKTERAWQMESFSLVRNDKELKPYPVVRKKGDKIVQRNWYIRFVQDKKLVVLPFWSVVYVLTKGYCVNKNECVYNGLEYNGSYITALHVQYLEKKKRLTLIKDAFLEEKERS